MLERRKSIGKAFQRTFGRKSPSAQSETSSRKSLSIDTRSKQGGGGSISAGLARLGFGASTTSLSNGGSTYNGNSNNNNNNNNNSGGSNYGGYNNKSYSPNEDSDSAPDSPGASPTTYSAGYSEDGRSQSQLRRRHSRQSTSMTNISVFSGKDAHSKGTGPPPGLNPADILLNRLQGYRDVTKNLQSYFTEMMAVEQGVSKALQKTAGTMVVPFKEGHQFMGKGGLQDVCTGLRDTARTTADQHQSAARFLEGTIVKSVRRLKQDIKGRVKALKADSGLYSGRVFKERELTQEKISALAKSIGLFEMTSSHLPDMEKVQMDPYLINLGLQRQLIKQVIEENMFAHALSQAQDQIADFEAHIINEIKQILDTFAQYQLTNNSATAMIFSETWAPTEMALHDLEEDTEWNAFLDKYEHNLQPSDLVDSNPEDLDYPCKESPYAEPVRTARMGRQSSVLKNWKDGYFVLSLAGWLHVFNDLSKDAAPERSIFLPTAILGPHSEHGQKQHVFSLEGKGLGGLLQRDAQILTIRANSREEMLDWWGELSQWTQSSTYTQQGDIDLSTNGHVSASGSRSRSGSMRRYTPAPRGSTDYYGSRSRTPDTSSAYGHRSQSRASNFSAASGGYGKSRAKSSARSVSSNRGKYVDDYSDSQDYTDSQGEFSHDEYSHSQGEYSQDEYSHDEKKSHPRDRYSHPRDGRIDDYDSDDLPSPAVLNRKIPLSRADTGSTVSLRDRDRRPRRR